MIIVGERINATRKKIGEALIKKDEKFFLKEAKKQIEAGSDFLDLNAGTGIGHETENLMWLINLVQAAYPDVHLALDSSNTNVLAECLPLVKNKPVMLNSVNAEEKKLKEFLPLVKNFPDIYIVALTMDDSGIPSSFEKRIEIACTLYEQLINSGVKKENIFYDALVQPVGTDIDAFNTYLKALRGIKERLPATRSICGLSNVSFGLPKRSLINKYAFAIAMHEGLDAVIIDPVDPGIIEARCIAGVLTGKDQFCMNYISHFREGKI
ncbi:MAG TPA: dihydropteroate synthase [bacterium]|nr:dihydropteroate synthase [bacterium]HOK79697.1 dihydropteroate synthase [bacterium]HOL34723.1 dihydropteroate synthase [bacterium]HPP08024.1 dihydropteroate synthase [bacterium]